MELCRLVGQLSIFHATRRPPDLPRYNHDDLGGCFHRVRSYLDELVDIAPEPDYAERDFIGHGLRMQVDIDPAWLDRSIPMYIGVVSPLEPEQCARELERLGTKIGSADRVEMIYRRRDVGLQFAQVPAASLPQALPRDAGPSNSVTYFQINRELQQNEWQSVESSRTLAIRFKEDILVGKIEGEREVTLRLSSDMTFRFTLYVLVRGGTTAAARPARPPVTRGESTSPMNKPFGRIVYKVLGQCSRHQGPARSRRVARPRDRAPAADRVDPQRGRGAPVPRLHRRRHLPGRPLRPGLLGR